MMDKSPEVRSPGRTQVLHRHRGFSLIEVMMSIVLLAIGTAIAIPSFQDQVEKRQVTNGAEQLASFVNIAQGTAMKMNRVVTVSWSHTDNNDWCIGAIDRATPCDCTISTWSAEDYCKIANDTYKLSDDIATERGLVHQIGGDGAYAFDPVRGLMTDLDDTLTMELRSRSGDYRLNLVVNNSGRVTVCSNGASYAIPGYAVCPVAEVELAEAF
jgi:type IV fimbrial biogenesis protein FimT